MTVTATAKWKRPLLKIPCMTRMQRKPSGSITLSDAAETWLIEHGYATAVNADGEPAQSDPSPADETTGETSQGSQPEEDADGNADAAEQSESTEADQEAEADSEESEPEPAAKATRKRTSRKSKSASSKK